MNIDMFVANFETHFPKAELDHASLQFEETFVRSFFDPCFDVPGMTSIKKQFLLQIAFRCLEADEAYFEIGTYVGKSLISALKDSIDRPVFACDNFSEFTQTNSLELLRIHLERYGILEKVCLYDSDFRDIMNREFIRKPVGLYFYDGAHDFESQYLGIKLIEPLLANNALVLVDDWRFAPDSQSYAQAATEKAIAESIRSWTRLYSLPARFNGDQAMWWNGIGVFASVSAKEGL